MISERTLVDMHIQENNHCMQTLSTFPQYSLSLLTTVLLRSVIHLKAKVGDAHTPKFYV